jgi:translation initiation factor 1
MGKKKKQRVPVSGTSQASLGSLADVFSKVSIEPSSHGENVQQETAVYEETKQDEDPLFDLSKLHIRIEKKGHKGKTVTVVEKIELAEDETIVFANRLKKALGCGGSVKDNKIYLQGNLTDAVRSWCDKNTAG